jgi:hypothetical protein
MTSSPFIQSEANPAQSLVMLDHKRARIEIAHAIDVSSSSSASRGIIINNALLLIQIMSMLSMRDRRYQCARVCRYWYKDIISHPMANIHFMLQAHVRYPRIRISEHICRYQSQQEQQMSNGIIAFNHLQTIRLIDLNSNKDGCDHLFYPSKPSSPSSLSKMISMPMLTTLSLIGCTISWNNLFQLITVSAPSLQHLFIHLELTMECHLLCDLFRRTRVIANNNNISNNNPNSNAEIATINGYQLNDRRCGRCQQLSGVLMTCNLPGNFLLGLPQRHIQK